MFCTLQNVWIFIIKTNLPDFNKYGHRYAGLLMVPDQSKQRQTYGTRQQNTQDSFREKPTDRMGPTTERAPVSVVGMTQSSQGRVDRVTKRAAGGKEHSEWAGGHQTARRAMCIQERAGDQDHVG